MADGALTLEALFPRNQRVRVAVRAMMADFKRAVREGELKDRPGEEAMAAGYARTLGEALDLLGNVIDVDLSERVSAEVKNDVLFGHLIIHVQRQLLLVLLERSGEVSISVDELESLGGSIAIDMTEERLLTFRRQPSR